MVCYPLPHRRQVNLALFAKVRNSSGQLGTKPLLPKALRPSPRVDVLLAAAGDSWTPWPLYTIDTPDWHDGNVGLLGDAAHAMLPFQAQGAAMGIEDADVLAALLVSQPSAETAFQKYHHIRRRRVARVARISATNGRIFHLPWPLSIARNMVIALQGSRGHLRRLAWLYGHDSRPPAPAQQRLDHGD